ncbi:MAG: adenylate/guanylate cyclase domain-containing protein [Acidimicrobiia bacterium]|nr:adenylate/guanylate cyclase domain-containing protein [Acidimicrobiia bacterium]
MQLSALRMIRFDAETERRFRADLTARVMPLGRLGAALGVVLFVGLAFWDQHIDAASLGRTMPIRLGVAGVFLLAYIWTFTPAGSRSVSPYIALQLLVGVAFPIVLSRLPDGFLIGIPGLLLPMSVVPIFSTTRWHAVSSLSALVALPNIVMVANDATSFEIVQANYWLVSGAFVAGALAYLLYLDRRRAFAAQEALDSERRHSESLLLNILPGEIVDRLKAGHDSTSDAFGDATVLFADIAGFTNVAESLDAIRLVEFLNELFGAFDEIVAGCGVEKIKTIGDSYMAVAGVPVARSDHAAAAVAAARQMLTAFDEVVARHEFTLGLRIGLHSGPLVGGVIGTRKFSYDVWGDTVNVASRMESSGVAGRIQLSEATRALLPADPHLEPRGLVALKGHSPIEAYLVDA